MAVIFVDVLRLANEISLEFEVYRDNLTLLNT